MDNLSVTYGIISLLIFMLLFGRLQSLVRLIIGLAKVLVWLVMFLLATLQDVLSAPVHVLTKMWRKQTGRPDFSEDELIRKDLSKANLRGANLSQLNILQSKLIEADLTDADCSQSNFSGADLTDAILDGANLQEACLTDVTLNGTRMNASILTNVSLRECSMSNLSLADQDLRTVDLRGAVLTKVAMRNTIWGKASFARLVDVDLRESNFTSAELGATSFFKCNLSGADMQVDLYTTDLRGSQYDKDTRFPQGFDPEAAGMVLKE